MKGTALLALPLAAFAAPLAAEPAAPLRTTAAIRALSADDLRRHLPVRLVGQVIARLQPGGFIIRDETGGYIFDSLVGLSPKVGDLITLESQTFLFEAYRQGYLRPSTVTVTGHAQLPTPRPTDAARIASGAEDFNLVTVDGFIAEVVKDENHEDWNWMVLRDGTGNSLYVSVPNVGNASPALADLVDAEVAITGVALPDYAADRLFIGPHLETCSRDCIRITAPRPADPFTAPYLDDIHHASPQEFAKMRRRRIVGRVLAAWRRNRFLVREDSGRLIEVDRTDGGRQPLAGERIEATGVCIMETDKWSPTNLFPVFGGFTLVPRTPADIRVLSRPPWWTPLRLCAVIGSLLVALVAVFVWNRILTRRVLRRSQQLFREQVAHAGASLKIGERTRLAVELHDALSQNLAGLACQISAAKSAIAISPAETTKHLGIAEKMLLSSRVELRRCLWDLRGDALETANMAEAVTKTVKPWSGRPRSPSASTCRDGA